MNQPSLIESTLGCFLHDMGKLWQRAGGSQQNLRAEVRNRASDILPSRDGRHTHLHALWTDEFLGSYPLLFPQGVNANMVRQVAVYHHNPDSAASWLCATADRLASGMDRKPKDEEAETASESPGGWDKFIKTPLRSCYNAVNLDPGQASNERSAWVLALKKLDPADDLAPVRNPDLASYPGQYKRLRQEMHEELQELSQSNLPIDVFCESILSLSERYLSTVPSSTIDQPDISLHDHARATAAVGAALYRYHECDKSLDQKEAIQNNELKKFCWVAGDLSGIQASLFRLANQQVRGVNKILRARSFLIAMLLEATLLECRTRLGLPVFSVLQNAGGRFLLLAANTPDIHKKINELRKTVEKWTWERYSGELAINLAVSEPFRGTDLQLEKFRDTVSLAAKALGESKLRAFETISDPVHRREYPYGPCKACNVRPGEQEREENDYRCRACFDEEKLGSRLPHIQYFGWTTKQPLPNESSIAFFGGWHLVWSEEKPESIHRFQSLQRLYRPGLAKTGDLPIRFVANYVPRLKEKEKDSPLYRSLSDEAKQIEPGELKTFEHLAADALETGDSGSQELLGEPFLAVLKADVDRLGQIFSRGIQNLSLGRYAAVSRFTDFFFTGRLMHFLREKFPSTYTVYAGGDDLLLIGPWRQMIELAAFLRSEFERWTGSNPSITLSAAIELMKVNHPLNRVARSAEERLRSAKQAGRNRVSVIDDEPFSWKELENQLCKADKLAGLLKRDQLPTALAYRLLYFVQQRLNAETKHDLAAANWRARWGYQLARNLPPREPKNAEIVVFLNDLLGLTKDLKKMQNKSFVSPKTAISIAIYKTRKGKERKEQR